MTLPMLLSWILCAALQTAVPTPPVAPRDLSAAALLGPDGSEIPSPTESAQSKLAAQLSAVATALQNGARVVDPQQVLPAEARVPLLAAMERLGGPSGVEIVVVILSQESEYRHENSSVEINNIVKEYVPENYLLISVIYQKSDAYKRLDTTLTPAEQLQMAFSYCGFKNYESFSDVDQLNSYLLSSVAKIPECLDQHKNPVYLRYHRFLASPAEQTTLKTSLRQAIDLRLQTAIFVISLLSGLGIGYLRGKAEFGSAPISGVLIFTVFGITSAFLSNYGTEYNPSISYSGIITVVFCWLTMRCFIAFAEIKMRFLAVFCLWLIPSFAALCVYPESVFGEALGFVGVYAFVVAILLIAKNWGPGNSGSEESSNNSWGPGACSGCGSD